MKINDIKTYPIGTIVHVLFETDNNSMHDRMLCTEHEQTGQQIFNWIREQREMIELSGQTKCVCTFSAIH